MRRRKREELMIAITLFLHSIIWRTISNVRVFNLNGWVTGLEGLGLRALLGHYLS